MKKEAGRIKREQEIGDNVEESERSGYSDNDLQWSRLYADSAPQMCVCILNYRDFASSGDHDITSVAMEMPRGFDFTLPVIIIDMLWGWILS